MAREQLSVAVAGIATLALVALTALPYALFSPSSVSVYYAVGILGPHWIALFVVIAMLTLVAGTKDRTDPAQAAGIAVTGALFAVFLAITWALPARPVAAGFDIDPVFGLHPPLVAASTVVLLAGAGGFAYSVVGPATE